MIDAIVGILGCAPRADRRTRCMVRIGAAFAACAVAGARPPSRHRCRGFTLLEILIVLALIASMAVIAVLHIGRATAPSLQHELDRVRALITLGSEQAIVHGADVGIGFAPHGYRFFQRTGTSWAPLREPRAYRDYRVAPGVSLRLRVEDEAVDLASEIRLPQVVLWSSGELTPFELIVDGAGQQQRLIAQADGALGTRPGARGAAAN